MDNVAIQTLEGAADIFMAPPSMVTPEQRHQAESVFLEFRQTKNGYQLCREILEKSTNGCVLFEAAGLLKNSIIREWSVLSESDISSLRQYLLQYLLEKCPPTFLRERLLQTIAIIIKRGSIDDSGLERRNLLTELENIIMNSPLEQQRLACSLIQAILQEYAVTIKSADVGLMWEVHFKLKKQFEAIDLKRIFRFTVGVLEHIVRSRENTDQNVYFLLEQLLKICETILCWGQVSPLLPKRLIGAFEAVYESDSPPALRLGASWRDTMLRSELVGLFFDLHTMIRGAESLCTLNLACLVQLASLSGAVMSDQTVRVQYLHNYVNRLLQLVRSIEPTNREMLGIADMFRKLVTFFPPSLVAVLPDNLPTALLQQLTTLTCHCIKQSIAEECDSEDILWRDSLSRFLDSWGTLLQHSQVFGSNALQAPAMEVFNTYLQCRLEPPDGTRATEDKTELSDGQEDSEDDRLHQSGTLQSIGAIARCAPAHCSHVLHALLKVRSERLENQLHMMHMRKAQLADNQPFNLSDCTQFINLSEDLHWIILLAGHFLFMESEGETPTVPTKLINFSTSVNADIDASLHHLVGESGSSDNIDPIVKLVTSVLRVSACECAALSADLGCVYSTALCCTVSWFLRNWAQCYLMPHQEHEMPPVFEAAWGLKSPGVGWVLSRLLKRVHTSLRYFSSEADVCAEAFKLLLSLTAIKDPDGRVGTCEEMSLLVSLEASGAVLSWGARRSLHRAFVTAAANLKEQDRSHVLSSTLSLHERLHNAVSVSPDTEPVRMLIADTLDCYIGVAEGSQVRMIEEAFALLLPALEMAPALVDRYHNYPAVVLPALKLLAETSKRLLVFLRPGETNRFFQVCLVTVEVYARWNSGRIASITQDAEEEAYEDIMAVIELLSGVLSKESIDMSSDAEGTASASAVCLQAIRLLVPLVTTHLLAIPPLAIAFYRMLRDIDPHQICNLPVEDFNTVINAIRMGLTGVSADVSSHCCECVVGLAGACAGAESDERGAVAALLPLAQLLLLLTIKRELPTDSIPSAGSAIYALCCVRHNLLQDLALQLLKLLRESDPANIPRLEESFTQLTAGVQFEGQRVHKLRFRNNFDKFVVAVSGFLIVK